MTRRYNFSIEFDGPDPSEDFSPTILKMRVERMILEELNKQENFRLQTLERLYNLKSISMSAIT